MMLNKARNTDVLFPNVFIFFMDFTIHMLFFQLIFLHQC